MPRKIADKVAALNLDEEDEIEEGEGEVEGPTSDKGRKIIDQLDDLDDDDLNAIVRRSKKIMRSRGAPKCQCGTLLIGRFKDEGVCRKCEIAQEQMEKVVAAKK